MSKKKPAKTRAPKAAQPELGERDESQEEQPAQHIATYTETRTLHVPLTDAERLDAAAKMAAAQHAYIDLCTKFKAVRDEWKGKIAEQESIRNENAKLLFANEKEEDVSCVVTKDYEGGTIQIKRADTGEVVAEREMTSDEFSELPIGEGESGGEEEQ